MESHVLFCHLYKLNTFTFKSSREVCDCLMSNYGKIKHLIRIVKQEFDCLDKYLLLSFLCKKKMIFHTLELDEALCSNLKLVIYVANV